MKKIVTVLWTTTRIFLVVGSLIYSTQTMATYNDFDVYLNFGAGYTFGSSNTTATNNSNQLFFSPFLNDEASVFQLQNVKWRNNYNGGGEGSVALGMDFYPNWRMELEFLYQNINRDIDNSYNFITLDTSVDVFTPAFNQSLANTSTQLHVYNFLFNLYYDFNNGTRWTPYLGVGIGAAIIDSSSANTQGQLNVTNEATGNSQIVPVSATSPALSGTPFVWQFKAGITYLVTPNLSVKGQYRLLGTSEISSTSSQITFNPNSAAPTTFYIPGGKVNGLLNNGFDLELQYKFLI